MYASNKQLHQQYANVQISTIDRGRLLLMLYDGCTKFLKHAKAGLEEKNIIKFAKYLSKSQAIIAELMVTLDFEKGGEIARDLERLYDFMLFYLTEANIEKNPDKIAKVIDLLNIVSGAYREIIEKQGSQIPENTAPAGRVESKAPEAAAAPVETPAAPGKSGPSISFSF